MDKIEHDEKDVRDLLLAFGAAFGHFEHVGYGDDVMHESVR